MNIIRNRKNTPIINLDKVTQIYPSICEKQGLFNLYFMFDAMNGEEINEVKWELGSVEEVEQILLSIEINDV